jgi:hypothetical protein
MVANFYSAATGEQSTRGSMTFKTLPAQTVMDNVGTDTKAALCPLNPAADSCAFAITLGELTDTLIVRYERHPAFISSECGCTGMASILEVTGTGHFIQSIEITNAEVRQVSYRNNIVNAENIRIYY